MDDVSEKEASPPLDQPDDWPEEAGDAEEQSDAEPDGSLADSVSALIEDGKTYAEAEFAFQKSRAAFAFDRSKSGAIFVLGALAFLHLALIGLIVGLVIGVSTLVGPWWGTAIVVGVLLLAVAIFLLVARSRFKELSSAFKEDEH